MERSKSVGIWLRVSTEFQVKDESPEHHEKRARLYAEAKGWNVVEVYHLEAVSGKSVMEHPEAKRMLRDIKNGHITGLIFSKLARLARNTKELLEFSDIFRRHNADLISLSENIDTSSSAGRLFYTMIAAMAEWERQEIAERVAASVPVRAKMGKPLGGAAPYGYRWEGKELAIDDHEAPVRRRMFELFLEHKRKGTVAAKLNTQGYRTRGGSLFTDTTIARLLRDPMAKGQRRANYTKSLGDKKHWVVKPEHEWVIIPCPAIVPAELWDTVNHLLDMQEIKRPPARKPMHVFAGVLTCECGKKMYVPSRTKKYECSGCKQSRIEAADLEEIYYEQLQSFLLTKNDLETFLLRANEAIRQKEQELATLRKDQERIKGEMDSLVKLHAIGQIPTENFGSYFKPLSEQHKQIDTTVIETLSQIDFLKMQQLNGDHILENAENLYQQWPSLEVEAKRQIVEELTESIVIGGEDITITFNYMPAPAPPSPNTPTSQHISIPALPFFGTELIDTLRPKAIENPQTLGAHIRRRRMELGLRQSDVAELLGVCEDTITGWENGRCTPQIQHYPSIIRFLQYIPFAFDEATLSGRIQKYRCVTGISQEMLADMLDVDETTVRSWERNLHAPFRKKLRKLEELMATCI